jgi:hypothetical protein
LGITLVLTTCATPQAIRHDNVTIQGRIEERVFCPAPGAGGEVIGRFTVTIKDGSDVTLGLTRAGAEKLDPARSNPVTGDCWAVAPFALTVERASSYRSISVRNSSDHPASPTRS